MDSSIFTPAATGRLVPIDGTRTDGRQWHGVAFVPDPLPEDSPDLSLQTHLAVADARAALAALDSTAQQLPDPRLLRRPTLQAEAQSTSALEGTYAPLTSVLRADEDSPATSDVREILNYVRMADAAIAWLEQGKPLTVELLEDLQGTLVAGTRGEGPGSGRLRQTQVVVGLAPRVAPDASAVESARFVPPPPGAELAAAVRDLLDWMSHSHRGRIDPVVATAMAHYQFEALHPFLDGNGRIGRLLVVVHLMTERVLTDPVLAVSAWFESRRSEYYDRLLAVSTHGDWDGYVRFVAQGLTSSADTTRSTMLAVGDVREGLREIVRNSRLRADTAQALIDLAIANPTLTVRRVQRALSISYGRANAVVRQLVDLGVLAQVEDSSAQRRFYAPRVHEVLLRQEA